MTSTIFTKKDDKRRAYLKSIGRDFDQEKEEAKQVNEADQARRKIQAGKHV